MIHINDYYAPILGEFEQLVLLALLRLGNGAYGAAILARFASRTGREVALGTLYMTLGPPRDRRRWSAPYVGVPSQRARRPSTEALPDRHRRPRALGRAYRTLRTMAEGIESELDSL